MASSDFPVRPEIQRIALTLQGGGALGAYQAGIFEALEERGFAPQWVAGTSIGAINGAIIAGNAPGSRAKRLKEFWSRMAKGLLPVAADAPEPLHQLGSALSAWQSIVSGRPGFFAPRGPALFMSNHAGTYSLYDTSQLRETLLEVVDFDLLNSGAVRLSVGLVHVASGRLRYFDNQFQPLAPEHIMASGALPPGFPAVRVDGELWWDGGVYSNTPLEIVLDDHPRVNTLCFMVDLFDPAGPEPHTLADVLTRHKNITYASRSRQHIENYKSMHDLRRVVSALYKRLPPEIQRLDEIKRFAGYGCRTTMEIVHLGYPDRSWEFETKDVDFSPDAIDSRWNQGYQDALRAVERAAWLDPVPPDVGVIVYDLPAASK